jgi:type II secretory pathway component PulK
MTETMAATIVRQRESRPFERAGALTELTGMSEDAFRKIYPHATVRSTRLRAVVRGTEPDSEATAMIEAVLSKTGDDVEIVYWREY